MEEEVKEKTLLQKIKAQFSIWHIVGLIVGLAGGFIYYRTVGCSSGSCPITGNPYISTIWGGLMGYLLADMFRSKKKRPAKDPGDQNAANM